MYTYSYSKPLSGKGRLFQPDNPEIELTRSTGLLYLDAIAQLKNVTEQLEECTYNVEGCAIKLCNRSIPSPSDYDLASEERYAQFPVEVKQPPRKLIDYKEFSNGYRSDMNWNMTVFYEQKGRNKFLKPLEASIHKTVVCLVENVVL